MPFSAKVWQLRWCGVSSMVTRHSKQIPIPQTGKRGSPVTECRKAAVSLAKMAVATVQPSATDISWPFTDKVIIKLH